MCVCVCVVVSVFVCSYAWIPVCRIRGVEGNCLCVPRAKSRKRQWKQGREEGEIAEREIKLCRSLQPTSCLCVYMLKKSKQLAYFREILKRKEKRNIWRVFLTPPVVGQANNWERKRGSNNFPQYDLSCFSESPLVRHCVGWNAWKQEVWFKKHLFNQHFLLTGTREAACRQLAELFCGCFS